GTSSFYTSDQRVGDFFKTAKLKDGGAVIEITTDQPAVQLKQKLAEAAAHKNPGQNLSVLATEVAGVEPGQNLEQIYGLIRAGVQHQKNQTVFIAIDENNIHPEIDRQFKPLKLTPK